VAAIAELSWLSLLLPGAAYLLPAARFPSFLATLECELLGRRRFRNQIEARMAIFDFLESWNNLQRRHSALGHLGPAELERRGRAA
jgi:transposase InsO family protein